MAISTRRRSQDRSTVTGPCSNFRLPFGLCHVNALSDFCHLVGYLLQIRGEISRRGQPDLWQEQVAGSVAPVSGRRRLFLDAGLLRLPGRTPARVRQGIRPVSRGEDGRSYLQVLIATH